MLGVALRTVLDFLFPSSCLGCGKEGGFLCAACLRSIAVNDVQVCPVCKKPSLRGRTHGGRCADQTALSGLIVAARYAGNPLLDKAIAQLKYRSARELQEPLGMLISDVMLRNFSPDKDVLVVPIPLHASRKRWRGFNQAEALANEIGKVLGIPVVNLLRRQKKTRQQAKLSRSERLENVKDAFELIDQGEIPPTPFEKGGVQKRILLIDDVASTLATLEEAAKVLKDAGYRDITGAVLARG